MPSSKAATPNAAEEPTAFPYFGWALVYIAAWTVFRLWFCTRLELVGDEAYYWVCSRHLALSYFDKGPGAAWTIALGTHLFGNTEFGVRWIAVLLSAGTGILMFLLARRLFSARVAFWTVVICEWIPLFAVGSILMTIDPISLFFWTAAAFAFWNARDTWKLGWWLVTGALVGLGALAKYTNLAELVSFALFCLWQRDRRHLLLRSGFFAMVVATTTCSLPMIIWNAQHGWVTVHHLAHRGALDQGWHFSLLELLAFLGGQAGVVSPLIFLGVLIAAFLSFREERGEAQTYLLSLLLPLLVGYATLSLNHAGQANWPAPAYVAGFILLVATWLPRLTSPGVKPLALITIGLAMSETLVMHGHTSILHLPQGRDPLDRARGSRAMAEGARALQMEHHADFLMAHGYQNASLLTFYLPDHPIAFDEPSPEIADQYSLWPGYRAFYAPGSSAIFASDVDHLPLAVRRDFENTSRLEPILVTDQNRPVRSVYYFLCEGLIPPGPRK